MRHLLYIVPILLGLWFVDQWLSRDRTIGWERNAIRGYQWRWTKADGKKALLLGSSTATDWLPADFVAGVFGVKRDEVLDAHINGCHQDCAHAIVRRALLERRRFSVAVLGVNLFHQCDDLHPKRILQQQTLLPTRDLPRALALHLRGEQPLLAWGRYLGNTLSGAYGDTRAIQQEWRAALLGEPRPRDAHRWYRPDPPDPPPLPFCDYAPEHVAYKLAVTAALLDDLRALTPRVILNVLPDRTLAELDDPARLAAWEAHRAAYRELAAARPHVTLVDLSQGGAREAHDFKDSSHLSPRGAELQRRLFKAALAEAR